MEKVHHEEATADRSSFTKRFWETQFKQKCFYNCGACIIKKQAIDFAKQLGNVDEIGNSIQRTEVCEIVATYSMPYRWLPFYGRFTFMIVSDKGHQEFFSVCRVNIMSMFKRCGVD